MSNYSDSKYQQDPNTSWYKILNLIQENSTVLDIGCSAGSFGAELISEKTCTVDGVELDDSDRAEAAKVLRKTHAFNIEHGAPRELWGKYDYVYYGDVIEHLVNPVTALNNTKKLLKEGGKVLFSIPNMAHMSVRYALLAGSFPYGETGLLDKTHLHFYDQDEVFRVFSEAGYRIGNIDYIHRDIPRDVQIKMLSDLGLKPTKRFLDATKEPKASGYQFVGWAQPSSSTSTKQRPKLSPPINEMEKHIKYIKKIHNEQIKAHKSRIRELEQEIEEQNKKHADLQKRYEKLKHPLLLLREKLSR